MRPWSSGQERSVAAEGFACFTRKSSHYHKQFTRLHIACLSRHQFASKYTAYTGSLIFTKFAQKVVSLGGILSVR